MCVQVDTILRSSSSSFEERHKTNFDQWILICVSSKKKDKKKIAYEYNRLWLSYNKRSIYPSQNSSSLKK